MEEKEVIAEMEKLQIAMGSLDQVLRNNGFEKGLEDLVAAFKDVYEGKGDQEALEARLANFAP